MKLFFLCVFLLVFGFQATSKQGPFLSGRFVAFDKLQGLNTHAPTQLLVVEVQEGGVFAKGQLILIVYYAKTTSYRDGAKFLGDETLNYANTWKLKTHQAQTSNERTACGDADNFWRAADGSPDENEKKEPLLRFRSTQFKGDVKFDDLKGMRCLILDSLES